MSAIQQALLMAANSAGDPYRSNVALLLHFDGADNSTTFTDSSANAFSATVGSPAKIKTDQSVFGGASGYFDGTTGYVRFADHTNLRLGANDFTIEAAIRPASVSGYKCIAENRATFTASGWALYQDGANLVFNAGDDNTSGWEVTLTATAALSTSTWFRVAVTRIGSTWRLFLNGVKKAEVTWSATVMFTVGTPYLTIGRFYDSSGSYNGHIDEFRLTNGTGRYSADYTVATEAFP